MGDADLVVTWNYNGNCEVTQTVTVTKDDNPHSGYSSYITDTAMVQTSDAYTDYKYTTGTDPTTTISISDLPTNADKDGNYEFTCTLTKTDLSTIVESVKVRVIYDHCTTSITLSGDDYTNSAETYGITSPATGAVQISVPDWWSGSSKECKTWGRGMITDANSAQSTFGDTGYDWISLVDGRDSNWVLIQPYTTRYTSTGSANIVVDTTDDTYLGTYTVEVWVYDGGDGAWNNRVDDITSGIPTLTLHIRDALPCSDGINGFSVTSNAVLQIDGIQSYFVHTIGDSAVVLTWEYTGNCEITDTVAFTAVDVDSNPISGYSSFISDTSITQTIIPYRDNKFTTSVYVTTTI